MTTENMFRLTAILLLISGFSISIYFRRRAEQQGQGDKIDFSEEKTWVYRLRLGGALLGYCTMLAYLIYPASVRWAQLEIPESLRWLGAGLMLLMLPLIYWLFVNLGTNVTPTVSIREKHELVTSGPYRYIRHPLYTFGFINFVGMSLLTANWLLFFGLIVGMFALIARAEKEEQNLLTRFGKDYQDYMDKTGRFFPQFRRGARN